MPTQIHRLNGSASLLPAQSLRPTPKCAYELRKSGQKTILAALDLPEPPKYLNITPSTDTTVAG